MNDLTAMFSGLKRAATGAREQLRELAHREELLRRERDHLKARPAAKADIKRMVQAWLDAAADGYIASLRTNLDEFIRRPDVIPEGAPKVSRISPIGAVQPFGATLTADHMDRALAALLREPLRAALMSAIDAMSWEEGPPLTERTRRLQKLEQEINDLSAQQERLVAEAREAGIDLLQR